MSPDKDIRIVAWIKKYDRNLLISSQNMKQIQERFDNHLILISHYHTTEVFLCDLEQRLLWPLTEPINRHVVDKRREHANTIPVNIRETIFLKPGFIYIEHLNI